MASLAKLTLLLVRADSNSAVSNPIYKMEIKPKTSALIASIKQVLKKNRGSLADDEVLILQNACFVLSKLDDVEPEEARKVFSELTTRLLLILLRPEILEQIGEWIHFISKK